MLIIGALLTPLFVYVMITSTKFLKSDESKNERGRLIKLSAYQYAFTVIPFGWFILEVLHLLRLDISYDFYRTTIWILVLLAFIVYGLSINYYKKRK